MAYPQDQELARQVIELGYKGSGGEVLRREEFEARKQAAEASRLSKRSQQKYLFMLIIIQLYMNCNELVFVEKTLCNNFILINSFCFRTLASSGKDIKDPFLKALAEKEEANRSGKMTVRKHAEA